MVYVLPRVHNTLIMYSQEYYVLLVLHILLEVPIKINSLDLEVHLKLVTSTK